MAVRMDSKAIFEAIQSTGFEFEYYIRKMLRAQNWQVINNRYYVDDIKNIEREIDIIAYKSKIDSVNKMALYTVLIISCKKCKESFWSFITYKDSCTDPNLKENVIYNTTNDERLEYMLGVKEEQIFQAMKDNQHTRSLIEQNSKVFAFQRINSKSFKTEDDRRIYDSIITCIKALEYEKRREPAKVKDVNKYFYNYNLLTAFDGDMIEVVYNNDTTEPIIRELNEIKYINRHIVNNKEDYYRVHFIKKDSFSDVILKYNKLWNFNNRIYPELIDEFYIDIFEDKEKVTIIWDAFCTRLKLTIFACCNSYFGDLRIGMNNINESEFSWFFDENKLSLSLDIKKDDINIDSIYSVFNNNEKLKKRVKALLFEYFRYNSEFNFDDYLPF